MLRLKGLVLSFFTVIAALIPLSMGGVYLYFRSSLPAGSGRLMVSGLQAPVEVIRDRWGVPHIYAQNEEDLFFAQGYVTAQDRLWQMELSRRAAQGTLAELLGESALASDRLARTLGFARGAGKEWGMLDPTSRRALEAYARGVNAWLATGRPLPPEFALLGCRPAPWRPLDSVAWARLVAWRESSNWRAEVLRARLVRAVGQARAAQLLAVAAGALTIPSELGDLAAVAQPLLLEEAGQDWPFAAGTGGDCWVIAGGKATAGEPILVSDISEPVQIPSAWYEVHLVGGRYDVIGGTLPGLPGVIVGRNRAIAWSSVPGMQDVEDLYVERFRPGEPPQVEYEGQWEDAQVLEEVVNVRGQSAPVTVRIYMTRHGPLVSVPGPGQAAEQVALRWAGDELPTALTRCTLALDRAEDWGAFRAALEEWTVPAQNLVYADRGGNIGYALAGAVPARAHGDGSLPVPGWTRAYEWQGFAPRDALPSAFNPQTPVIVAASDPLPLGGAPEALTGGGVSLQRANRIYDLVQGYDRLTVDDARVIQTDIRGPQQPILSLLLALPPQGWLQERTMPYLRAWDFSYDAESAGAGIFEVFYWRLVHNTLDDELGAGLVDAYLDAGPGHYVVMAQLCQEADNPWFDDQRTPERENRDEIMTRSYAEALDWLGRRFGDLPYEWNWGRVHNVTFKHALGQRWPLTLLLNRGAMRASGAPTSISATGTDYSRRMAVQAIPAHRMIIDLGDSQAGLSATSTGQSGNPLSPHYADMIELWRQGRYHPLLYEREAILQAKEGQFTLVPAR